MTGLIDNDKDNLLTLLYVLTSTNASHDSTDAMQNLARSRTMKITTGVEGGRKGVADHQREE